MNSRQSSPTPLLRTCRPCAHAKIKCARTQDKPSCDRCLRLGKECTFAPARGRRPPGPRARPSKLLTIPDRSAPPASESPDSHESDRSRRSPAASSSHSVAAVQQHTGLVPGVRDPFDAGQLTIQKGEELLDRFRTKLTPHFPFVIITDSETVSTLRQTRPALCLALLAAASYDDVRLQRALGKIFNELVAVRLLSGDFACLDILQGLLVHLAWAHFQPRPKRYTQHLHLATSIISDLRLDRPKNPRYWGVEFWNSEDQHLESLDEQRTYLGTHYLLSCSSIVLQKLRIIALTGHMTDVANRLADAAEHPMDRYLPYIIRLQRIAEDVDDIVKNESRLDPMQIQAAVSDAKEGVEKFKSDLTFPLGDCPILVPQMHTIQLCINQLSLPDSPFGLNNPQNPSSQRLIQGLSESIVSAKSLVSVLLHTPSGQEVFFPNMVWVMLHCGFTLAAWLDVQAADPRISFMTEHLRQFSDVGHTIRQVVLRLEAATSEKVDDKGDRDSFYHFLLRARRVEEWYLRRQRKTSDAQGISPQSLNVPATSSFSGLGTPASDMSIQSGVMDFTATSMFSQSAIPALSGGAVYSDFPPPEVTVPGASLAVDSFDFANDLFIPFKAWGFQQGGQY